MRMSTVTSFIRTTTETSPREGTGKRREAHARECGALDSVSSSKLAGLEGGLPGSKSEHQNTIYSTYHLHKLNVYAARQNTHSARTYASNTFTGSTFEWLPKGTVMGLGTEKTGKEGETHQKRKRRDLPGGPVVKNPPPNAGGHRFDPWSGIYILFY